MNAALQDAIRELAEALTKLAQRLAEFTDPPAKPDEHELALCELTIRTAKVMAILKQEGRLPDFKPSSIRSISQHEWLREPNFGRKSLAELVELCGNW